MQVGAQYQEKSNAITHSPYYGCTVRVVSKAGVSYEGVLDGISINKDRIFLKNVHVNANITSPHRAHSYDNLNGNSTTDTLNAVMMDHLTNDIRIYEQVCLNVADIEELRLIELPSTFHESKEKLRAIDPCLVDIRLSPSDEYETGSNGSSHDQPVRAPIARKTRGKSFGSNGGSALISSSSNESSSSFGHRSTDRFGDESNDESIDEQIEKFRQVTFEKQSSSKPVTLLAKKILPKKLDRRPEPPMNPSINVHNQLRSTFSDQRETPYESTRVSQYGPMKKGTTNNSNRKTSPLRVTITSKLNPNATPFIIHQRNTPVMSNPPLIFYDRPNFRPFLPPVVMLDRSQSLPYEIQKLHHYPQQIPPPAPQYPQQQQSQQRPRQQHQRFIPPRQMAMQKNMTQGPPQPIMKYRIHPSTSLDKRIHAQQQQKVKSVHNGQNPFFMHQTSRMANQTVPNSTRAESYFGARNDAVRRSTTSIRSTTSLPFPYSGSNDRKQMPPSNLFADSIGSHRNQRTFSGASSGSSLSLDILPHAIIRNDSPPKLQPSFEEQYDFEKANEEFRRYLELEELVVRPPPTSNDPLTQQQQQSQSLMNLYKKECSFFDQISCTATTGTAVGYTEIDETEKNLETFGDDALFMSSNSINEE